MKLHWTAEAVADRNAIYDHIEACRPRAAIKLDMLFSQKAADIPPWVGPAACRERASGWPTATIS